MKSEKFLRSLGGIDSELVEKARQDIALWEESREGVRVEPAPRKPRWKAITAACACAAAAAIGAVAIGLNVGNRQLDTSPADSDFTSSPADSDLTSSSAESENGSISWTKIPSELPIITADIVMGWDADLIYDVLGNGKPVLSIEEHPDEIHPDETRTVWLYDKHGEPYLFFGTGPERFYFNGQTDINYTIFSSSDEIYYYDPIVKHSDALDGFSEEDAIERVRDAAEKLGITNLGKPSVFAMTAEDANAYFENYDKLYGEGTGDYDYTPWTKDDEAYFLTFPFMFEGIPISTTDVWVDGYYHQTGAFVKAIVTKDEIVCLEGWGITSPTEYTLGETVKINYSADDILNEFNTNRPVAPFGKKVEFRNCELVYAPIEKPDNNKWVYAPAWRVNYAVYRDTLNYRGETIEFVDREYAIYSAETGERIMHEWDN